MENQRIESMLLSGGVAINNSLSNAPILNLVCEFGYDETRLQEGKSMWQHVSDLQAKQKKEYGDQYHATDALGSSRAIANGMYMIHVKVGRIALRNDRSAYESLQLNGSRSTSLSGWLTQAKAFYSNALGSSEILKKLERFNITRAKLEEGKVLVDEVEKCYGTQLKETGEAQAATVERDQAFDEFEQWVNDYKAIARIALAGQPQFLEVLGIIEPS